MTFKGPSLSGMHFHLFLTEHLFNSHLSVIFLSAESLLPGNRNILEKFVLEVSGGQGLNSGLKQIKYALSN